MADGFLPEVFANLLGDIRHYGGSGVNCRIRVEPRGDEVLVSIEDDGPGIPDREKERLFARPAGAGTAAERPGLGLSIAGALVRRYGGRIWADDREGERLRPRHRDLASRSLAPCRMRAQRREKSASSRAREKITTVGRPCGQVRGVRAA